MSMGCLLNITATNETPGMRRSRIFAALIRGRFFAFQPSSNSSPSHADTAQIRLRISAERSPIKQLLTLARSMHRVGDAPVERALIAIFHRPENRPVHDRISERILARLQPPLARIIADGIAAGVFRAQDSCGAAGLVLSTFSALHHLVSSPNDMPEALAQLNQFVLRGLGYGGDIRP